MADQKTFDEIKKELLDSFNVGVEDFKKQFDDIADASNKLLGTFTQGRQRIGELRTALADALPDVTRLGGGIADVQSIIADVAEQSRRNVVASSEEVEMFYAANKVLGLSAQQLSKSFLDVGIGIEKIGENLNKSIEYVQSVGGNAKTVMQDVQNNMEQMNRYQFEGGVVGLTKMAAQASMLRFDMFNTFTLAEKVLDPQGAVDVAAAFQRLGVAAGTLVDPFALMNASINDPSGLQDSLANVSKQFTYFDEETQSFKINPQGVLVLREMEKEAGLATGSLSKMGLAAAELDERISQVGEAGLNIKEEDKMYLANIAKMGEGGQYEVKIKGQEDAVKLGELTQEQLDDLIKEQREGPKTMEELAKAQMSTTDIIMGDVKAIKNAITGGVVTAGQVTRETEGTRGLLTNMTGTVSESLTSKAVRGETTQFLGDIEQLVKDLGDDSVSSRDDLINYLEKAGLQLANIENSVMKSLEESANKISANIGDESMVERLAGQIDSTIRNQLTTEENIKNQPISSLITGSQTPISGNQNLTSYATQLTAQNSKVEMAGGIKIEVKFDNLPSDLTPAQKEQIMKQITDQFNSFAVQNFVQNIVKENNPMGNNATQYLGGLQ
jgi:hypothetical protein